MKKTLTAYITGFAASIALTLAAYFLVAAHVGSDHSMISHQILIPAIIMLALAQLVVQLLCFLHLNFSSGSERWKTGIFISTFALVLLVVIGSIWIMGHLNYNMTPAQVNQYMQDQQGGF